MAWLSLHPMGSVPKSVRPTFMRGRRIVEPCVRGHNRKERDPPMCPKNALARVYISGGIDGRGNGAGRSLRQTS